ncbi:MAG: hypothetical protein HOW73_20970 [Polyangiaceae bacterium]|nr:hypothetical protein [Polyangiaceae bacterium]
MRNSASGFLVAAMIGTLSGACDSDVEVVDGGGGSGGAQEGGSASSVQGGAGGESSAQGGASQGGAGMGGRSPDTTTSAQGGSSSSDVGGSSGTGTMICDSQGPCGDCVAQACPEVWCGCVNNPDCLQLFGCTAACPSGPEHEACIQSCMSTYPDGISDAVLATGCASDPCSDSCPQAGNPLTPCEECTYSTCPDAMNTCLANSECLDLYGCLSACGQNDLSCHQGCYNDHPDGIEPLEDVLDCTSGPCEDSCN